VSFKRHQLSKPDKSTQDIVDGLRKCGYTVIHLGHPVDLDVTHPRWGANIWKKLECKSRKDAKGNVVLDKRQKDQLKFCSTHQVPYVTDVFEARLALGEKIAL
jgi:hypothetical protein